MKKLIWLTVLCACLVLPTTSVAKKEVVNVYLQMVLVDDISEIPDQRYEENGNPMYAGMYQQIGKVCRVTILKPESWDDDGAIFSLGHETYHCYKGPHTIEYIQRFYPK